MSTSQRTLDQVKSILGKLDRNIDAARARRTQDRTGTNGSANHAPTPAAAPAPAPTPAPIPMSTTTIPAAANAPARSQYGRATPMRLTRQEPLNKTGT